MMNWIYIVSDFDSGVFACTFVLVSLSLFVCECVFIILNFFDALFHWYNSP